MIKRAAKLAVPLALVAAVALPAEGASARKVGNPGGVTATVVDGTLRVGDQTFTFDPGNPIVFSGGSINAAGAISFPANDNYFPPMTVDASGITATVRIRVPSPGITGTLNPLTGATNLNMPVWIKIDGIPLGGDCHIASSGSPINVTGLTSGTSGALTGVPYNPGNGQGTIVRSGFNVPAAADCGFATGTVNGELGLPTSDTEGSFELQLSPVITKGVNASFTATPTGPAPLPVNFDASASTRTCSPNACQFQWDFDNNGSTDQTTSGPTTSFAYATPGTRTARVTVVDTDGDTDTTTRSVTVATPPDLTIDKSHSGDFLVGGSGSYSLAVQNLSSGATAGTVTVTDTLPAGLTPTGASGTGWSCNTVAQAVTCTRASVAGSSSAPAITVNVNAGAAASPSVVNTAGVSTVADSNSSNNSDSDPTNVNGSDLDIDKTHTGTFGVGREETYTLTVTNNGPVATSGVTTVTDTLPAGLTHVSASGDGWSCGNSGQTVTCTSPAGIPNGDVSTIAIAVAVGPGAVPSVTNTAAVSTPGDPVTGNDSASDPTTVVNTPDLSLDKSHSGAFRVGGTGSYTIAVRNLGARATAGTTTVSDTLPAGLTPVSATGTDWSCDIAGQDVTCTNTASISPNASYAPIALNASVAQAAFPSVTNTATVSNTGTGDDADPNPANDTDSDPTAITAVDLTIDKSHVGGFAVGEQGNFNLSVSNVGSAPTAGPTTITDTLPAELSFVSGTGAGWTCGAVGQDVTCTRTATIAAGATADAVTLTVAVDASTTAIETTNTASVSTTDDVNPLNDSDTDTAPLTATDLSLDKSHGAADFRVGTTRAYTLRVENVGSQPTQGDTTVTDTLPAGLTYVDGTGSGWACGATGQDVTCTRTAAIASGASAPAITLRAAVGPDAHPGVTNSATAANTADRNSANDTDVDPTTVVASDLALDKSHTGNLRVGARASYSLAVSNAGEVATGSTATVTDTLPAGLTYAGSTGADWDCSASGQIVTCAHDGSIPAGGSAGSLEIRADVGPSASSTVTNSASVSVAGDPESSNDSDSDPATVERVDLSIDKSHTGSFRRGGQAGYQLEVSNDAAGVASAGPTTVTDDLPAGLTYEGATGTGWSCSVSSGTVTCTSSDPIAPGADAEPITLTARVAEDAPASISNTATVHNAGDGNGANDSDTDPATVDPAPDAAITIRPQLPAGGSFRAGTPGTYTLAVRNVTTQPISGVVSASVALPAGASYLDSTAAGWNCSAAGQAVTCVRASGLAAGARSDIGLEVGFTKAAGASVTTTATVDAPGDDATGNDSDSDTSPLKWIDLAVTMSHSGSFAIGGSGAFTIDVQNAGTAATTGPQTVNDTLPAGLAYSSASGAGWNCSASGQTVTCVRAASLGAGAAATPLTLNVVAQASGAGQSLSNTASVATNDDADGSNDSATDQVTLGPAPQAATPPQTAATQAPTTTAPATGAKCKKPKKGKKGGKKCGKRKKK